MMPLEKKILNKLLDSYESSKLLRGENKVAVHIAYAFQKKNVPEYFNESSTAYEEIHAMLRQLEERGFLRIEWKNKKVDHIVQKVILCEYAIPEVYQYVNRVPRIDVEAAALELLGRIMETDLSSMARAFALRMGERIRAGRSVKEYVDISDLQEVEDLVRALDQIEKNEEECFVREFSIRHFHDSKRFEMLSGRVCKILREGNPEYEGLENDELLSEFQIYHTPSYVYLKGAVRLKLREPGSAVDFGAFSEGLGFALNGRNLSDMSLETVGQVEAVYTIENLTTFFRFKRENSLIIYLGGYHNHVRRALLKKIYEVIPKAQYFHFGDIDAGGFQIYYHLKERTSIPFEPYQMDLPTLKKYEEYGKRLTENDRSRLARLMDTKMQDQERQCAEYMLKHNVKLEQECIQY